MREAVENLHLNLTSYTILTEVGSGPYLYTPIIAALANSKKVFAWTRDSTFGNGDQIVQQCNSLLEQLGLKSKVHFEINNRPSEHIQNADLITNSGFVRPLDSQFLEHVKASAVIPLMFEAWEFRESDIDIEYCKTNNIKVAGTNEHHPSINVFGFLGPLALKLAFNSKMEILRNSILIWSDDDFGKVAYEAFKSAGADKVDMTIDTEQLYSQASGLDFIFICDYSESRVIIGDNGIFDLTILQQENPALTFVHLYGRVDPLFARKFDFNVYPEKQGYAQVMTETLGHVGLKPFIDLQVAGFKVGAELLNNKLSELSQPLTF
jgi:hypothetical protein